MLSLDTAQANFIATINNGPDALDHSLFTGPLDRVLLGLKAHANTINHARLVALEETFPLTRQALGEARFNHFAREFVGTPVARASDNNSIGLYFSAFLDDPAMAELATIEWVWLENYHAADATPLKSSDLGTLDEAALLAMPVAPHPSARLVPIMHPLAAPLGELVGQQPAALLIVRPEAEVRLIPLDAIDAAIFGGASRKNATLGNLLAAAIENAPDTDPSGTMMKLIGAGALIGTG